MTNGGPTPIAAADLLADIAPGRILASRWCVLEGPFEVPIGWRFEVTDLARLAGEAPTHRLSLHVLGASEAGRRAGVDSLALAQLPALVEAVVVPDNLLPAIVARFDANGFIGLVSAPRRPDGHTNTRRVMAVLQRMQTSGAYRWTFGPAALAPQAGAEPLTLDALTVRAGVETDPPAISLLPFLRPAPFVGRDDIFERMEGFIEQARVARPALMYVHGTTGSGKSRVLEELNQRAARQPDRLVINPRFLWSDRAYTSIAAAWIEGAIAEVAAMPGSARASRAERLRAAAGPLLGLLTAQVSGAAALLGEQPPAPPIALQHAFTRHASVIAAALATVGTRKRPLILVAEGADQLDPGTLEVVRLLQTSCGAHHTVILLTGRSPTLDHSPALAALRPIPVHLPPFSRAELSDFLRGLLSSSALEAARPGTLDEVVERLERRTGGQPLHAWLALRAWVEGGRLHTTAAHGATVDPQDPSTPVIDLYRGRCARLSPDATAALAVLIAACQPLRASDLGAILGAPPSPDTIEAVLASGLAVDTPNGGLRPPHDQVREIVALELGSERIATANLRLAAWEAAHPQAHAPRVATYLERGSSPGPNQALADAHLRAGRLLLGAYELTGASSHLEHAIARSETVAQRVAAATAAGDARLLAGDTAIADAHYRLAIRESVDPVMALQIAGNATHAFLLHGAPSLGAGFGRHALRLAGEPAPSHPSGVLWPLTRSLFKLAFGGVSGSEARADALCVLYRELIATQALTHPLMLILAAVRGRLYAVGRRSPAAAAMNGFWGAFLSAMGMHQRAQRTVATARSDLGPGATGFVPGLLNHFEGQIAFSNGEYEEGERAMGQAELHLNACGASSLLALDGVIRAVYGAHRLPGPTLLNLVQAGRRHSLRQGERLARATLDGALCWLDARNGCFDEAKVSEVRGALNALEPSAPTRDLAHAFLIRAQIEAGRVVEAVADARACGQLALTRPGLGLLDVFIEAPLTAAEALVRFGTDADDLSLFRRLRRHAAKARGKNPRVKAALGLLDAHGAARDGRLTEAIAHAQQVVDDLPSHGELGRAREAHLLLMGWSSTPERREEHRRAHSELSRYLDPGQATDLSPAPSPAPPQAKVTLAERLHALTPRLDATLPAGVGLQTQAEADLACALSAASADHLLLALVFTVRDACDPLTRVSLSAQALRFDAPEAAPTRLLDAGRPWARLRAEATGHRGPGGVPGLGALAAATRQAGGVLDVVEHAQRIVIDLFLPRVPVQEANRAAPPALPSPAPSTAPELLICHPEARVSHTLLHALSELGYRAVAQEAPNPSDATTPVITDPGSAARFGRAGRPVLVISAKEPGLRGLRFPPELGALDRAVAALLQE